FVGLKRVLGDARRGAAATAMHRGDVDLFLEDILDRELELRLRAARHCAEVVLCRLEHLHSPLLGRGSARQTKGQRKGKDADHRSVSPATDALPQAAPSCRSRSVWDT